MCVFFFFLSLSVSLSLSLCMPLHVPIAKGQHRRRLRLRGLLMHSSDHGDISALEMRLTHLEVPPRPARLGLHP